MDIVTISNLKIETLIGVYPWEQKLKQTLILTIEYGTDARKIAATDTLQTGVDYAQLVRAIIHYTDQHTPQLIETLAVQLTDFLQQEFKLPWLRLKLTKISPLPEIKDVSICIEKST